MKKTLLIKAVGAEPEVVEEGATNYHVVMVLNSFHAIVEAQNFSRKNLGKGCFAALVTVVQC